MFNSNFNRLYIHKNTKNLCFGSLLISSIISSTLPVKADASLEELKARVEKAQKENLLLKAEKIERENLTMKAEALEAENAALRNESKRSKNTSSTLVVQSPVVITSPTTQSKQAGNKISATNLIDHSKSDHALNAALDSIPKYDERREMTAAYKPVSIDALPVVRQWQGIYAGINAGYGEGQV